MTKTRGVLDIMRPKKYYFTVRDVAEMAGISLRGAYRLRDKGVLNLGSLSLVYGFIEGRRRENEAGLVKGTKKPRLG